MYVLQVFIKSKKSNKKRQLIFFCIHFINTFMYCAKSTQLKSNRKRNSKDRKQGRAGTHYNEAFVSTLENNWYSF